MIGTALSNYGVNATVRPFTPLACASVAPRLVRGLSAAFGGTTDEDRSPAFSDVC